MNSDTFWHNRDLKIDCLTLQHILSEKILNPFVFVDVRILVEKWNIYKAHIFPRPLPQTCRLETTSLCLNSRVRVNKNFHILITILKLMSSFFLCVHPVMWSIILHTRRPNCQYKVCYTPCYLRFSWFSFFEFWGAEKHVFHIAPSRPSRYVL